MPDKKHIVIVANTAWSIYQFRKGLIKALIQEGYQVTTIAPDDPSTEKLQKMGCSTLNLKISSQGTNPIQDSLIIWQLFRAYTTLKPDFVFHYTIKPNIYGAIACKLAKVPCICVTTGLGFTFVKETITAKFARLLYRFALRFPQEVWFLNEDDRRAFIEYQLVSQEKTKILDGEGVDLSYYQAPSIILKNKDFTFLLVARMLWDKGVGEYVEAARIIHKSHPNVIFQLLGSSNVANPSAIGHEKIEAWVKEGTVNYLGEVDDVRPIVAQANCIVLPSSYREGVPRILLEAAAMEKPIITTDAVGCKEAVIDGKTGFLCAVKDVQSLVNCMLKLIQLTEIERINMGKYGRQYMERRFSEDIVIACYKDTLKNYLT